MTAGADGTTGATGGPAGVLVVTGTGTGIHPTVVTAAVAALARAAGRRVAVVKPAQTGTADGDHDTAEVARLAGLPDDAVHELASYPEPLAPATAARRAGLPAPRSADTVTAVRGLAATHDLVLVEGAGGLLVRFADDPAWTLADLAVELAAPVVVVAAAGLGTLNHTALTGEALRSRGLVPRGVVVGSWPAEPDLAARCNLVDLGAGGAGPLLGALPAGLGRTRDPRQFLAAARAGLTPSLGGGLDAAHFVGEHGPEPSRPYEPKDAE